MKKIVMTLAMSVFAVNTWAACGYNFDATQADLQTQNTERFTTVNGSEVSYSTVLTNKIYAAMSKSIYNAIIASPDPNQAFNMLNGDKPLSPTGIQAFEFKIKVPQIQSNTTMLNIFPIIAGSKMINGENFNIMVSYQKLGTTNSLFVTTTSLNSVGQTVQLPIQNTVDGYQNVGIYLNQNTNQIGVIFNGVNKGYLYTYPSKFKNIYYFIGSNYTNITTNDVGKKVEIKLITDASKITQTYPTGTTDICGIAI